MTASSGRASSARSAPLPVRCTTSPGTRGALWPRPSTGAGPYHLYSGPPPRAQCSLPSYTAPDGPPAYDRTLGPCFFGQICATTRQVHDIAGDSWGPLAAPIHGRWSEAMLQLLEDSRAD